MNAPYRDADLLAEIERLRGERDRLVEALAFSRPAKPAMGRETTADRISRVGTAWYFCAMSAVFPAFPTVLTYQSWQRPWVLPLCLLIPPLGFAVGWLGVSFHRWAMRVSP